MFVKKSQTERGFPVLVQEKSPRENETLFVRRLHPKVRKSRSSEKESYAPARGVQKVTYDQWGDTQISAGAPPPYLDVDEEPPVVQVQASSHTLHMSPEHLQLTGVG